MTTEFKKGDKVRVTLEGTVTNVVPFDFDGDIELRIERSDGDAFYIAPDPGTVEKVEEPVEVFGPGTIVRHKREGSVWAIGDGGYLRLDGGFIPRLSSAKFTSADFELHEFKVG